MRYASHNHECQRWLIVDHFTAEPTPNDPIPRLRKVTYSQLYALVADIVSALVYHGIKQGDRVASYSSNCIVRFLYRSSVTLCGFFLTSRSISQENVAACLATSAIGGIWVSAAADFGPAGVIERYDIYKLSGHFMGF